MGNGASKTKPKHWQRRIFPREPVYERIFMPETEDGYPPAKAPKVKKSEIYSPEDNRDILVYARKAPTSVENSWEKLIDYLTSSYRTEVMKVRSIFSWLGTQDIENESFVGVGGIGKKLEETPRGYKKLIKERSASYASFFCLLCRKAGFKCALISGISKGVGYEVGDKDMTIFRDKWNAVFLDGWRLIHPLWAFKTVTGYKSGNWSLDEKGGKGKREQTEKEEAEKTEADYFNEYYFMVDPAHLNHQCLPDNQYWQLVSEPMTYDKFVDIPLLQKTYFIDGCKIVSSFKGMSKGDRGVSGVTLKTPSNRDDYQVAYDLFFNHVAHKPDVDEPIYLRRFVMMCHDISTQRWTFEIRMPIPGTYRVALYGGSAESSTLNWLCDVGFSCKKSFKLSPYPDVSQIGNGPVKITEQCGLSEPSHPNGMLFLNPRQEYHITFRLLRRIDAKVELKHTKMFPKVLAKHASSIINNQSTIQVLDVCFRLPEEGEYALKIYTKDRDLKQKYTNACNYYLSTDAPRLNGTEMFDKGYDNAKEKKIRDGVMEALKTNDLEMLKTAVDKYQQEGLREKGGEYHKAVRKLEYMTIAKEMKDAINRRNDEILVKAIEKGEASPHRKQIENLIKQAQDTLEDLRVNKYAHAILDMRQSTITEVLSYSKPQPVVQDVLMVTLLLLGDDEEDVRTWDKIRKRIRASGKGSLMNRVRSFNINYVTKATIDNVAYVVKMYDEDTVRLASPAAATFYLWCNSVVNEYKAGKRR